MIDFIITHRGDIHDVCNIHVMHTARCNTVHSLVWFRFKHWVDKKNCLPGVKIPKRLDVNKPKQKDVCANLTEWVGCLDFDGM